MPPSCHAPETAELAPRPIRAAVCYEMHRRDEECHDFGELIQGFDPDGQPRQPLAEAVTEAVLGVLNSRLAECESYARLLAGRRVREHAEEFGIGVVELLRERLDAAEDIVPFEECDWARMRGILCPEDVGPKTWRKLSEEGWLLWPAIRRRVLPEIYGEPPQDPEASTGAVHRTPQRVAVLARRWAAGLGLYHPDDQLEPGPGEALEPLTKAANGRKSPSTVDGVPVEYQLVRRGEQRGRDVVAQSGMPAEWRTPCLEMLRPAPAELPSPDATVEPPPVETAPVRRSRASEPIPELPAGVLVQGLLFAS